MNPNADKKGPEPAAAAPSPPREQAGARAQDGLDPEAPAADTPSEASSAVGEVPERAPRLPGDGPDQREPVPEAPQTPEQRQIAELLARNEELSERLRQYAESVDRMRREFDASRDRLEREAARKLSGEMARAAGGLLGVLDNLDKTLAAARDGGALATFLEGVGMVRGELEAALGEVGIERFEAVGERFDPERHRAMTTLPVTDEALDGRVVESFAAGAVIGEEVVRPAVVVVGKFVETGEQPS